MFASDCKINGSALEVAWSCGRFLVRDSEAVALCAIGSVAHQTLLKEEVFSAVTLAILSLFVALAFGQTETCPASRGSRPPDAGRGAPLLLVLSQNRGGVLGRVAQQALHLLRIPDSSDRDLLGHVRGAVLLALDDLLHGLRGMDRYCRLEQAPLILEAVVPLSDLE